MRREPCEVCGKDVTIASRHRYLQIVHDRITVRCEQCRRYVSPGTARVTQMPSEYVLLAIEVRRKIGRGAKRTGVLESCPLGRCGATTCEVGGAAKD